MFQLHCSQTKAAIDGKAHFEHLQIIRCDIKPGSAERSINLHRSRYIEDV
jgi:hypothetical protein